MEREVGGGIGMGHTCKPMAHSFQCMTKPTTIKNKKNKTYHKKKKKERETRKDGRRNMRKASEYEGMPKYMN